MRRPWHAGHGLAGGGGAERVLREGDLGEQPGLAETWGRLGRAKPSTADQRVVPVVRPRQAGAEVVSGRHRRSTMR